MPSNLDLTLYLKATEGWLDELMRNLAWHDRRRTWSALLTALHALRDCFGRDEAIYLGAQLPQLLRGFYYEGWHPHAHRLTSRDVFLERIRDGLKHDVTATFSLFPTLAYDCCDFLPSTVTPERLRREARHFTTTDVRRMSGYGMAACGGVKRPLTCGWEI